MREEGAGKCAEFLQRVSIGFLAERVAMLVDVVDEVHQVLDGGVEVEGVHFGGDVLDGLVELVFKVCIARGILRGRRLVEQSDEFVDEAGHAFDAFVVPFHIAFGVGDRQRKHACGVDSIVLGQFGLGHDVSEAFAHLVTVFIHGPLIEQAEEWLVELEHTEIAQCLRPEA